MNKLVLILGAAAAFCAAATRPSIVLLEGDAPAVHVRSELLGKSQPDWSEVLIVSVDKPDAPALAGAYKWEPGSLTFTPRYRMQPGLPYRATFRMGTDATLVVLTPAVSTRPATVLEQVYPTSSTLPENQLKLYLVFSAPMSRGEAFKRVHLINLNAKAEVKLPFLEIDEELWDREQKRLTILFDPGRVKRGLVPSKEVGPPLVAGGRYRLVVDAAWKDAESRSLRDGFVKEFSAGPAWRQGIDIREWKVVPPQAGTKEALTVDFPRPLDSALLQRCLKVVGVAGESRILNEERRWTFVPGVKWDSKPYSLKVLNILEDLAGNKVGRPFDVDRFEQVEKTVTSSAVRISFTPYLKQAADLKPPKGLAAPKR